jgi:hypothetical protein
VLFKNLLLRVRLEAAALGALISVVLAGCSTPYQEMGYLGGVTAEQMTNDTYRIISRGNQYTAGTTVQDHVLLKAAETTKQAGGTHFALISAQDASRVSYNTSYGQGFASTSASVRPGENAFIRVLRLQPGQQPPHGAFAADEIIKFTGARVKRPQS